MGEVQTRLHRRRPRAFLNAFQYRSDASINVSANLQHPTTRGIKTFVSHLAAQTHDAQTDTKSLLRVLFLSHDRLEQLRDVFSMLLPPFDQTHRIPFATPAAVRGRYIPGVQEHQTPIRVSARIFYILRP